MIKLTYFSLKIMVILLVINTVFAQNLKTPEYVSLEKYSVYDVEIIIFAYDKALPNRSTYTNKTFFNPTDAYRLNKLQGSIKLIKEPINSQNNSELTIPIKESENNKQALVWFEHSSDKYKLNDIWNKLQNKNNITPLVHRSWRQVETPFEEPQYVEISTVNTTSFDNADENNHPDLTLIGKVSLSKGRYLHFGHKINLFRQYQNNGKTYNMLLPLTERKQLYTGELNYYDSPWFGSIVKITKVNGE